MSQKPHIVVVVQARMGSTRLPGKVMLPLAGEPLLLRVVERVLHARVPHSTIIATSTQGDDDRIEDLALRMGVACYRGHLTDLLDRHYRAGLLMKGDVVVKIPSDCPLIDPNVIDRVLEFYLSHISEYDYVSNLHPETYPYGQDVEVIPMPVLEVAWKGAAKPHEREHTTPFIWAQPKRFRIGNVKWESGRDLSMAQRWVVDHPQDYELVSAVYDGLYSDHRRTFGIEEILEFLDHHEEVHQLNRHLCGIHKLPESSLRVRRHVVRLASKGGCFIGAVLSCVDVLNALYTCVLRVDPNNPRDPGRDYLILSKGHAVPALYAVLAERGFFPLERLEHHLSTEDLVYWHPNTALPGVELNTGSLGHGLSVGVGIALSAKMDGAPNRVIVVLGDGELQEGSVWEAVLVAAAKGLDNLIAIVDRNRIQANVPTEDLIPLEPLERKFESFGWSVKTIDGHNFEEILSGAAQVPFQKGRPSAIIANTVRGKGIASLEGRVDKWFVEFSEEEAQRVLEELGAVC